jgi:CRP/FNR family transcriptional regulator
MGYEDYQAKGIAESRIRAVAIPRALLDRLNAGPREFRRLVSERSLHLVTG